VHASNFEFGSSNTHTVPIEEPELVVDAPELVVVVADVPVEAFVEWVPPPAPPAPEPEPDGTVVQPSARAVVKASFVACRGGFMAPDFQTMGTG